MWVMVEIGTILYMVVIDNLVMFDEKRVEVKPAKIATTKLIK